MTNKSLRIGLNFIKVKWYFRLFCIFCIFVVLTIHESHTAPSPSPQVSAIPEKRKKWCMKIYLYIVLYILKYLMTYGSNIFHGLNLQMDPLIKLLLIRRKRWRKKWVRGCQVIWIQGLTDIFQLCIQYIWYLYPNIAFPIQF